MKKKTNLVVGAGFSGAVIANLIAASSSNQHVILINKKNHIAGNCFDFIDENGIMIHKYGSHIFHTKSGKVWNFLNKFTSFNTYMHEVKGIIDGIETNIPFNFNSLYQVFPYTMAKKLEEKLLNKYKYNTKVPILEFQKENDEDLKYLANYVYEKIFLNYTIKQWGLTPDNIDSAVTARVPVYLSKDNRYFQDKYQGIPQNGYSKTISNMINYPNIELRLQTDYKEIKQEKFDRIFFTGSIDEFFDYKFGMLPYRCVEFKFETHNIEFYQDNSVINYPDNYDFTRIHEFKHFLKDKSDKTVIAKEYSNNFRINENERYYPVSDEKNLLIYNKYLKEAKKLHNVYFFGRLGDYKYYNIDIAVLRAMELFEQIKKGLE